MSATMTSKGGSVDHSADARTGAPPAGFSQTLIDPRLTIRDSPSIRPAPHRNGRVYAAYFSWRQSSPKVLADVVVARDDNFATGANPFTALVDSGDGLAGQRVALSVPIPWFFFTANERVGSALSIAVDPTSSRVVYLAWGDASVPGSVQTLHVRRSTDRGVTWSGDLVSVNNATNPALAITSDRKVGFLYQQSTGSGGSQRWETHVQITRNAWKTPARDILLANTPVDSATYQFDPYIGDYADLQAVGRDFYGIFSAHNRPDHGNFPHGVVYRRNANFVTKQLLNVNGITPVAASIDPFFFHIFWREEREEEEREGFGRERLRIRGLEYERLRIRELDFEADAGRDDDDEGEEGRWRGAGRLIRRLADRIEDLGSHGRLDDDDEEDEADEAAERRERKEDGDDED